MRSHFVQIAREILKGEGLNSAAIRKIAKRAGLPRTALREHFRGVDDLILECIRNFQEECEGFVRRETEDLPRGTERVKGIVKAYIKYFAEYPEVFELLFLDRIPDIGVRQPVSGLICSLLDKLCDDEWRFCVEVEIASTSSVDRMRAILRYQVPGLLLLFIGRRCPPSLSEFLGVAERQLDRIIRAESSAKPSGLLEPAILNFLFEDDPNSLVFIHYAKERHIADKIIREGFRYAETFYNTAEQVVNDKLDLMYKHNMYKYYGSYVVVIAFNRELFARYTGKLNARSGIHPENVFCETPPFLNDNDDKVYTLPCQFIKGYVNYTNGSIVRNPSFNPSYSSPAFEKNLE